MKSLKLFVVASLLAGGFASANTTDHVYIVGAPAYRQDSIATINAVVSPYSGAGVTATSASTVAAFGSANQVQWFIPNYTTGVDLIVNASFTGSSAGIESVAAGSITQKFIPDATGTVGTPVAGATATEAHQPDFTLSDTFQQTTPFNGTVTLKGPTNTTFFTKTYQNLTVTKFGVEPYKFVASPGAAAAGLTNISASQAQLLFKNGALPLAFFTGNSADQGKLVYGLSRDPGSGARLIAVAETGIGVKTPIVTYKPTVTGGTVDSNGNRVSGTISDDPANVAIYPKGLIASTGVWDNLDGDTGYPSFGGSGQTGLLLAITSNFSPAGSAFFITYFNVPDGTEAIANGAEELTYNGVPYSLANVAQGKYTFWSYTGLFKTGSLVGNQLAFANAVTAAFPAHATVPLSSVSVSRTVDGGDVTQLY